MSECEVGKVYQIMAKWRILYADDFDVLISRVSDGRRELVSRGNWDAGLGEDAIEEDP